MIIAYTQINKQLNKNKDDTNITILAYDSSSETEKS